MPLVSLCMIMKNEEEELPLVIASAAGLADEIVIYDTGSTDRSVAVARRLGATVVEGYWDDDFARARNEALEHCAGEWILWLDADEAISGDKEAFRSRLNTTPRCDCYVVAVESLEGGGLAVRSAFHAARVFRRERCHWFGPIHEQVGLRGTDAPPPTEACSELRILHRGYTMLKRVAKDVIERNLQIARRALDDPGVDRARALFDYGRTLTESDDPSAAVAPLRQAADTTAQPSLRRAALRAIFYVHLLQQRCRRRLRDRRGDAGRPHQVDQRRRDGREAALVEEGVRGLFGGARPPSLLRHRRGRLRVRSRLAGLGEGAGARRPRASR